jgi:hypothetical protein
MTSAPRASATPAVFKRHNPAHFTMPFSLDPVRWRLTHKVRVKITPVKITHQDHPHFNPVFGQRGEKSDQGIPLTGR